MVWLRQQEPSSDRIPAGPSARSHVAYVALVLYLALFLGAVAAPVPTAAAAPTDPSTGSEDASPRYGSADAAAHRAGERDSAESDSAAGDPDPSQPAEDASPRYGSADAAAHRAGERRPDAAEERETHPSTSPPPRPCDPDFIGPVAIGLCPEAELAALRQRDLGALVVKPAWGRWMQVADASSCRVQGGGVIRGPGSQQYAIITSDLEAPRVERIGPRPRPLSISVPDDGVIGTEVEGPRGIVEVGDPIPGSAKAAPALIGGTGGQPGFGPITFVQDPEGGRASIVETRAVGRDGYPERPVAYNPPPDDGGLPANAKDAGAQAVGLVNGALAGIDRGQSMDDERLWNYQVVYYKGHNGSRRARLKMSQKRLDADGNYYEDVAVGSFGADGKIVIGPSTTSRVEDLYDAVILPSRR